MQIFQQDPCLIWHLDWMELRCSSEDPAVQFQEARLWCPESTKISLTERSSIFILHYQRDTLLPCQDSWLVSSIIMIAVSLQGGIWTWRINWHCRQAQKGRFMCREKTQKCLPDRWTNSVSRMASLGVSTLRRKVSSYNLDKLVQLLNTVKYCQVFIMSQGHSGCFCRGWLRVQQPGFTLAI